MSPPLSFFSAGARARRDLFRGALRAQGYARVIIIVYFSDFVKRGEDGGKDERMGKDEKKEKTTGAAALSAPAAKSQRKTNPPKANEKEKTSYAPYGQKRFFMVRETGIEPVRCNHTPLKRARLPVPPLSREH